MLLSAARTLVRAHLRSGDSTDRYPDTRVDAAILDAGNDFVNRTRCTSSSFTVNLVADSDTVSFSGAPSGFRAHLIEEVLLNESADYLRATIGDGEVRVVDLAHLRRKQKEDNAGGAPILLAFVSETSAEVWPTPEAAGTLTVWYDPPFTVFTPGADGATVLNIPDHLIQSVLANRAALTAQLPDVEPIDRQIRTALYEQHVRQSTGHGRRKIQSIHRETLRTYSSRASAEE
jgi:hypothetical protein